MRWVRCLCCSFQLVLAGWGHSHTQQKLSKQLEDSSISLKSSPCRTHECPQTCRKNHKKVNLYYQGINLVIWASKGSFNLFQKSNLKLSKFEKESNAQDLFRSSQLFMHKNLCIYKELFIISFNRLSSTPEWGTSRKTIFGKRKKIR